MLHLPVHTTGSLAKLCGVAPRTCSKWFDTGKIKGYRIPGSLDRRMPRESVLRFLAANKMDAILAELEVASSVLLAGLSAPLEQRITELLLPHMPIRTARCLFDLGMCLHDPPAVAVVDLSIGGRVEVLHAIERLTEDTRRVIVLLPECSPEILHMAFDGCSLLQHPVDAAKIAELVKEATS